jgi:hypothetical protein
LHWIRLAEGKVLWRDSVNAVMNFLVAWRAENLMTSWTTTSCSIHGIHLFFFFCWCQLQRYLVCDEEVIMYGKWEVNRGKVNRNQFQGFILAWILYHCFSKSAARYFYGNEIISCFNDSFVDLYQMVHIRFIIIVSKVQPPCRGIL